VTCHAITPLNTRIRSIPFLATTQFDVLEVIHSENRRYPDRARTTTRNVYSFHSATVDARSLGVESIPYALFPSVPTPDVTRFQGKMHRSGQWIKCTSYTQRRRNVQLSGGASCRGMSLSAECLFSRTLLKSVGSRSLAGFAPPEAVLPRGTLSTHSYSK
jgi:hypothetical protein